MKKHHGKIIDSYKNHQVLNCKICGFAHLYPLPSQKTLKQFYHEEFYQKTKPDYLNKTKRELDYWRITYNDRLKIFNKYLKRKKGRILDIGCSGGFFLKFFKNEGWDVLGIEPSPTAINYARNQNVDIINAFLEDIPLVDLGKFDAINMSFVLEHVFDPINTCKMCYKILNKNGLLCIETPNDFSPLQQIVKKTLKKSSYWIAYPDHINYFTPQSLENILNRVGFKSILKESTFPMEVFLLMEDDYIDNDRIGRKCHKKRMNLEINLWRGKSNELKRQIYQYLAKLNIGREIIIYGQKKV